MRIVAILCLLLVGCGPSDRPQGKHWHSAGNGWHFKAPKDALPHELEWCVENIREHRELARSWGLNVSSGFVIFKWSQVGLSDYYYNNPGSYYDFTPWNMIIDKDNSTVVVEFGAKGEAWGLAHGMAHSGIDDEHHIRPSWYNWDTDCDILSLTLAGRR